MNLEKKQIIVVSDGTGETASQMIKAAMVQFNQNNLPVPVIRYRNVRDEKQLQKICRKACQNKSLILYTIVSPHLRAMIAKNARECHFPCVDLLGPLLSGLGKYLGFKPKEIAGLLHDINDSYFDRVEAIEYTLAHDDGKNLESIEQADLVILGISRTSKTPLSMYLSHQRWRVANIPIILDFSLPPQILRMDPRRIIGLTIEAETLSRIRKERLKKLHAEIFTQDSYSNLHQVYQEIEYAHELFRRNKQWTVLNVTGKALEETASEIIKLMVERRLTPPDTLGYLPPILPQTLFS